MELVLLLSKYICWSLACESKKKKEKKVLNLKKKKKDWIVTFLK